MKGMFPFQQLMLLVMTLVVTTFAGATQPSDDEFYKVPDNIDDYAPGAIIRHRPPPNPIAAFGSTSVNIQGSYQILYRTTDSLDNATATVLTVLVPHNADFSKVLSYQLAEDSATINCAPSFAFQLDSMNKTMGDTSNQAEMLLIAAGLRQNWVVVIPDALGPQGAFLANALAGHAILDGIRAAIGSGNLTGIKPDPSVALWGYSGGSVASLWAAELQPSYAPELDSLMVGAAVGGIVPNITTVLLSVNKESSAGLIPPGMLGLSRQYPQIADAIGENILPQHKAEFYQGGQQCLGANKKDFSGRDVLSMFKGQDFITQDPVVVQIQAENNIGKRTPKFPLLMYKAIHDMVSPMNQTDDLVRQYCESGATIEYLRDDHSSHASLALAAAPKAMSWLIGRMNNSTDKPAGCSNSTVTSSLLSREALTVLPGSIVAALKILSKRPLGDYDL